MKKLLFSVGLLLAGSAFGQQRIYVDKDATSGSNNGSSWANAYTDLQSAFSNLSSNAEIWIASGTYKPVQVGTNVTTAQRETSFVINHPNVKIYGGFAGTETTLAERDYTKIHTTYKTVLDGDLKGNDGYNLSFGDSTKTDNSYCVVKINSNGDDVLLDGLEIVNGNANGDNNSGWRKSGAGITVNNGATNMVVKNTKFEKNSAYYGAGINTSENFTLENCIFNENLGVYAAAYYISIPAGSSSGVVTRTVKIYNSLFTQNVTKNDTANNRTTLGAPAGWMRVPGGFSRILAYVVNNTYADNIIENTSDKPTLGMSRINNYSQISGEVANNIFWGNTCNGGVARAIDRPADSHGVKSTSIKKNLDQKGALGGGSINVDPHFNAYYGLEAASGAINEGVDSYLPSAITKDLAGNDRIKYGTIDLGAFEFDATISAPSNIVYVNKYANGSGDGSSWDNAYNSLQDAFDNVPTGGEVWIRKGVYELDDRTSSYIITKDDIKVYGGFAGNETSLTARDMSAIHTTNATVLSGDVDGDDGAYGLNNSDNAYHVLKIQSNAKKVEIHDLEVSGGHANGTNLNRSGAGIDATGDYLRNLTLKNCIFKNNVAHFSAAVNYTPASVNTTIGEFVVDGCKFENNRARLAPAIGLVPDDNTTALQFNHIDAKVINSLFVRNKTADGIGASGNKGAGGVCLFNNHYLGVRLKLHLINNTFAENLLEGTDVHDFPVVAVTHRTQSNTFKVFDAHNNIFWNNRTNNLTIAKAFGSGIGEYLATNDASESTSIKNNLDPRGLSNVTPATNTIVDTPLFVSDTDFRLQADSPAIDAGDDTFVTTVAYDIAGENRIQNTHVDLGAYESATASTGVACTSYVTIPDTAFKQALLSNTSINKDGDNEICATEALLYFGNIDVANLGISDLTGIEAFENIAELNCSNNALTSLDVTSNTQLTKLNVSDNALVSLKVNNTNNEALLANVDARNNPDLSCIQHDPQFDANARFYWQKDDTALWNDSPCSGPNTAVVYVNPMATSGNNDGSSWDNAYTDLQTALTSMANSTKSVVWIAKGKYITASKSNAFTVNKSKVQIFGGFDGTEEQLDDRDMTLFNTTNETILSGDVFDNDGGNNPTIFDNAYTVFKLGNNVVDIMFNGVTISGANANQATIDHAGAINAESDNIRGLTLKNCTIKNNTAEWGSGIVFRPHHVEYIWKPKLIIDACVFENNQSQHSSCILTFPDEGTGNTEQKSNILEVQITNTLFNGNKTGDNIGISGGNGLGGLLWFRSYNMQSGHRIVITNNTFVNNELNGSNSASDFPIIGVSYKTNGGKVSKFKVDNNIFWGNTTNGTTAKVQGKVIGDHSGFYGGSLYGAALSVSNNIDQEGFSNINHDAATSTDDPLFISSSDFNLQANSPAINSGNNSRIPSSIIKDLEGNKRIIGNTVDRGAYESNTASLSVDDTTSTSDHTMKVYPNPVSETLYIEEGSTKLNNASMYNSSGQLVLKTTKTAINVSSLPAGMYIMQLENTKGDKITKKIIKK